MNAFAPKSSVGLGRVSPLSNPAASSTAVKVMDAAAIQEMETARAAFVLCFAGALGTAAVGREGEFGMSFHYNCRLPALGSPTEFLTRLSFNSKNCVDRF